MRKNNWLRATSLSQQYFLFSVILPLLLLAAVSFVGWFNYKLVLEERRERIFSQAGALSDSLIEPLVYMEGFAQVISERIIQSGKATPESVATILKNSTIPSKIHKEVFAWTLFDFVNPEGWVVASSIHGVLPNPKHIDPAQRSWIREAPLKPGQLLFSKPDIGLTSGKWIIPGGYGVVDAKGNFLGTVSLGISIDKLLRSIAGKNSEEVNFMLLDSAGVTLVISDSENKNYGQIALTGSKLDFPQGKFGKPLEYQGREYSYYKKIPKYDFVLLFDENNALVTREFHNKVLPQIIQTLVIGAFLLLMMYFFKRKIVSPILELSHSAEQIMLGKGNIRIPRKNSYEIYILARQLMNMQRYIRRIQRIDQRLFAAKKDAERANRAKSDFLANMSHELRTPLNAIIGYSEMIKSEILGPVENRKYKEYAYDIHSSGIHLLSLINDILDISKAESGKFEIIEEIVDIRMVVDESVRLLMELAAKKGVAIDIRASARLPLMRADKLRLKQIVINLLSNAVKFSGEGDKIEVTLKEKHGLVLVVEDHGIGIAQKDIPKILEKFGHIKSAVRQKHEGTGLGLWLTQMLVEAHGATLSIESELEKGTKVTVHFPEESVIAPVEELVAA